MTDTKMPDNENKETPEVTTQPEAVKVGDKAYTQEQLNELVQLGETAKEYEDKWNRKVSEFYPDYTQKSQRLAELEREEEERKQNEIKSKVDAGQELSPQELEQRIKDEARRYGLVTEDLVDKRVQEAVTNALETRKIMENIDVVIAENKEKGLPEVTPVKLAEYMQDNGIRYPDKAYKLMFESEIDKWKSEKLTSIKPTDMVTQNGSTAGAKEPGEQSSTTRDTLGEAIRASLTRNRGV